MIDETMSGAGGPYEIPGTAEGLAGAVAVQLTWVDPNDAASGNEIWAVVSCGGQSVTVAQLYSGQDVVGATPARAIAACFAEPNEPIVITTSVYTGDGVPEFRLRAGFIPAS